MQQKIVTDFQELAVMLTVGDVARVFGISRQSVYSLFLKDPAFPVLRIGRSIRIPKEAFLAWVARQGKK